jgi:hypothetical protein
MFCSRDIGSNIVVEPEVLYEAPRTPEQAVPAAPAVHPGLMPGRDNNNDVSVGNKTAPTGNTGDVVEEIDTADRAPIQRTLLGRTVCAAPLQLISNIGSLATQEHVACGCLYDYETALSQPEYNFYAVMTQ